MTRREDAETAAGGFDRRDSDTHMSMEKEFSTMFKPVLVCTALALGFGINAVSAPPAHSCPPGLAKKNPPCLPPGLVGKGRPGDDRYRDRDRDYIYRRGDYIDGRYYPIDDPRRYGLNRGDSYARIGNYVYRIDRETREVLDLIGAVSAILN